METISILSGLCFVTFLVGFSFYIGIHYAEKFICYLDSRARSRREIIKYKK